jgi:3-dehydroquinate synthase
VGLSAEELADIKSYFLSLYPKYNYTEEQYPQFIELMKNDKKNEHNKIGFSLLKSIGECQFNIYVSEEDIKEALNYYVNN